MKVKDLMEQLKGMDPEKNITPSILHSLIGDEDYEDGNMIGYAVCPECGETVILADCETDKYFTHSGDRCIYHICSECGEPIENIDLINGNKTLPE